MAGPRSLGTQSKPWAGMGRLTISSLGLGGAWEVLGGENIPLPPGSMQWPGWGSLELRCQNRWCNSEQLNRGHQCLGTEVKIWPKHSILAPLHSWAGARLLSALSLPIPPPHSTSLCPPGDPVLASQGPPYPQTSRPRPMGQ